ncbi:hypothetical protein HYPSUDRAFT_39734 [Hypholoma sublateritium FD-334 SS-4]|uniref:Uncharacterized protein n=1 Tax=Hypholoma sublateritium (strain FD-334 SS-4) TaxID=945553 RepID=A0A0D2PVH3_HYPSF|nr:hypothetical protein HYPSUDRAFT_39734 [Hypholoma sublateritium FD-334 SS-4]
MYRSRPQEWKTALGDSKYGTGYTGGRKQYYIQHDSREHHLSLRQCTLESDVDGCTVSFRWDRSLGPSPALGYNRGIFVDHRRDAWLMHYTLPDADGAFEEPTSTRKCITSVFPSSALQRFVMHEDIGRILLVFA